MGEVIENIKSATESLKKLNEASIAGNIKLEELSSMFGSMGAAATSTGSDISKLLSIFPGFSVASKVITGVGDSIGFLGYASKALIDTTNDLSNAYDNLSSGYRTIAKNSYDLGVQFGLTLEESQKFSDFLTKTSTINEAFGYVDPSERNDAAKAFVSAGISIDRMTDSVKTSSGEYDALTSSILQASALGMDVSKYMSLLSTGMMKGGLTMQQATEQIAGFGAMAREIGLPVESVAQNLNSLADNFSLIGIKADFGAPILEGFAKSLSKVGMGLENSLELTKTFTGAIERLTSDYSTAYYTFSQGGLELGSGGTALGASIDLRQKLRTSKETGSGGEVAMDIAKAIKETIANQTGGRIITLEEASKNADLETVFYKQEKMLESLYGISDVGQQDAVMDLLSNLGQGMTSGNKDALDILTKVMDAGKDNRNSLVTTNEILEKNLSALLLEANKQTLYMQKEAQSKGIDLVSELVEGAKSLDPENMKQYISERVAEMLNIDPEKTGEEWFKRISEYFESAVSSKPTTTMETTSDVKDEEDNGKNIIDFNALITTLRDFTAELGMIREMAKKQKIY